MKNIREKKLFIPAVIVLSLILVVVLSFFIRQIYTSYRMQKLPRMRIVLEVNIPGYLEGRARNTDKLFTTMLEEIKSETKNNPDSDVLEILHKKFQEKQVRMSRYYGYVRDSDNDVMTNLRNQIATAIDRDGEIIRNRLDQYGAYEPSVQKNGLYRFVVEFPTESVNESSQKAIRSIFETGLLEFKLLKDPEISYKVMETIDKFLAGNGKINSPDAVASSSYHYDSIAIARGDTALLAKRHPFLNLARPNPQGAGTAYVAEDDREKIDKILSRDDIKILIPNDVQFLWSARPALVGPDGRRYFELYLVKATPELTGAVVVNARATTDSDSNQPEVMMEMNSEGALEWARITGANIDRRIAIIMDNAVFSAPRVRSKITGGRSQITGIQTLNEAQILEIVLKAGAIPAPLDIIKQEVIEANK